MRDDPVVVTGKGGSGTRVYAQLLEAAGVDMGHLNSDGEVPSLYNLVNATNYLFCALKGDETTAEGLLRGAVEKLKPPLAGKWGFKQPMLYITVPILFRVFPRMTLILVVRDGRDMLHAKQNSRRARILKALGENQIDSKARFWARTHRRALDDLQGTVRFLISHYERLCEHPHYEIERMLRFLEIDASLEKLERLSRLVKPSKKIGRWKSYRREAEEARPVLEPVMARLGYIW